jgi:hypothetical protein
LDGYLTHVFDFGYFGFILTIERVLPKHIFQHQMHVLCTCRSKVIIIEIFVYVYAKKMAFAIDFLQYNNPKP